METLKEMCMFRIIRYRLSFVGRVPSTISFDIISFGRQYNFIQLGPTAEERIIGDKIFSEMRIIYLCAEPKCFHISQDTLCYDHKMRACTEYPYNRLFHKNVGGVPIGDFYRLMQREPDYYHLNFKIHGHSINFDDPAFCQTCDIQKIVRSMIWHSDEDEDEIMFE